MVFYRVDLISVYSFTIAKFVLNSVPGSFHDRKRLSPLYVAVSYFSFKRKRQCLLIKL